MKHFSIHLVRTLTPILAALLAIPAFAATPTANVSITLNPGNPGRTIPTDFLGVSLEMSSIEAADSYNNGTPFLSASSGAGAYGSMLKKIGVGSIRVGGNSSERQPYATATDGNNVEAFAEAIGANLIWTVPVKTFYDPTASTAYVQGLYSNYQAHAYNFGYTIEVGNEPDNPENLPGSDISYATWQSEYDTLNHDFRIDVNGSITATGPSVSGNDGWPNSFSDYSKYQGSLKTSVGFITQHSYPDGDASPTDTKGHFQTTNQGDNYALSSSRLAGYLSTYNSFGPTAISQGFQPRIEETNMAYGGSNGSGVTNTYAAALWAMDYLCYYAYKTSLEGMNIHNGPTTGSNGSYNVTAPVGAASAYTLEGVGYGMWAFHYGSQGQPIPTTITNNSGINLTAYGLLESNGGETVHIINKTFNGGINDSGPTGVLTATNATVTITPGGSVTHAQVLFLKQENNDITAQDGITFGGEPLGTDGVTWGGGYGAASTLTNGTYTVVVPYAEAAIVHFY